MVRFTKGVYNVGDLRLRSNCTLYLESGADCAIRGGNFGVIDIDSVEIKNLDATLVKVYGEVGKIKTENLCGIKEIYTVTDEEFEADPI